ncbi:MAG TPA: ABC transporter ATP-binding protein [Dongiaceae bacterium]|jgi:multiple sugar transport system ATP-binding protein
MAEIQLQNVDKRFGAIEAIKSLNMTVGNGKFVVLLGPTGAGKTTTLRLVAGLEQPDNGAVHIGGHDVTRIPPAARDVAFVFQQYSLYPHLTVFDNLAFPLRSPARRLPADQIKKRVEEVAELLRISSKLANRATRLSGGEMQRVAIGRALVRQPSVYLMDEPLSSLDAKLRADLRLELKRIQQSLGATVLYVTHDQIEAMTMATEVGVLKNGELIQFGTPRQIYEEPGDVYVATRLGVPRINLLAASTLPHLAAPAETATVGVRTEHVRLQRQPVNGMLRGEITRVEHLGDQSHLHLDVAGQKMVLLADPHEDRTAGDILGIEFTRPLFFDAGGRRLLAS